MRLHSFQQRSVLINLLRNLNFPCNNALPVFLKALLVFRVSKRKSDLNCFDLLLEFFIDFVALVIFHEVVDASMKQTQKKVTHINIEKNIFRISCG